MREMQMVEFQKVKVDDSTPSYILWWYYPIIVISVISNLLIGVCAYSHMDSYLVLNFEVLRFSNCFYGLNSLAIF